MKNNNVVIISSIDWSTHWQMHHQLATSMIGEGNRVLFVENTGARGPRLADIGRVRERIINWVKSVRGFREVQPGLTVFSPLFLPFPYSRVARGLNRFVLSRSVKQWMRSAHFHNPVIVTFLPTPLAQALIKDIDAALVIYYCVDNMAGSSPEVQQLKPWEEMLFRQADLVFVTSAAIRERAEEYAKHVFAFPCGVDFSKFAHALERADIPDDLAAFPSPVIGYVGALSGVLDQTLLLEMARQLPFATFVLVGPFFTDVARLKTCENIKLLGPRPHDEIPAYIKGFDVALIPYLRTAFTDSVYSCKLNEYLAMGKAVVSTNIREVRSFAERSPDTLLIGQDNMDFISKVTRALDDAHIRSKVVTDNRIAVARENTWEKRFSGIVEVIDRHLLLKSQQPVSWKESLAKYYKDARTRWAERIVIIVSLYLIIFTTPLVWFVGDQLVVRHEPRKTDAIVVFSGNGETSYRNNSYQRRALDAVRFYKKGYAPHIYLSSGRNQDLSEVEVIKLYLLEKGVSPSAIHILDQYPGSTFENVQMVTRQLRQQGAHSIILLTAPYHGRRALWTWRKETPDLLVYTPAVVDTPAATPQWSANVDQIRIISYEYAAIAYNWLQGRL
ncbi:DUF218 domain-containing protein [Chlorobium sp. BLA1]|uniref:ElyC/SanA/YdcF family protein n=1 Tax=Candidatus Chlorobium masyuteum TaxID=2716876 RepID=UPI0014212384|nr:ElyC/SanA/YdcF family protein [Candidatus Chlorobium masyuteum]NHQ59184.1 DUF218 domain-containing protein [Candidatus Chlorobium masyuteum]